MNPSTDDEFIPPLFIHTRRTYVEEISLIPGNLFSSETSSEYDVPDSSSSLFVFNDGTSHDQEIESRYMQLAELIVNDPEALLEPNSNGSRTSSKLALMSPENVRSTYKMTINCDKAEEKINEDLSVDADVKMTEYHTDHVIFEDHCYFEKHPPTENPNDFNAMEQEVNNFDLSDVNQTSDGSLVLQENFDNIVPNDNAISDIYIEDFGTIQEVFPTINEELNEDADDFDSFDDLHGDAHICPDVQVLKKPSYAESDGDQSVPDMTILSKYINSKLNTEREFYKHCNDDSCAPHKPLRVGLSKKQKVIPLHGIKF